MKLINVVDANPALFYEQGWWREQEFAHADNTGLLTIPELVGPGVDPELAGFLPHASTLAMLYVSNPDHSTWRNFLWTADKDYHGNRVYVGGVGEFGIEQFQVHRALDYTNLCAIPVWPI